MLGAYELESELEVPYRVAINEAVELAKLYGGTDGYKFVNGVMDKLAFELREIEVTAARGATGAKERRP
jgi:N utilization substance protein B